MSKLDKVKKAAEKGKVDKLITYAKDAYKGVRLAAITGLGEQTESEASLNALIRMMDNSDPDVRREVAASLGSFKGSYVETQLQYYLFHEKDETVLDEIKMSLDNVRNAK
ncbi:MAG: HEAT repeat domain-containing protein [Lachnospiraceae bacterium]|nr:HEAT repeat domain-containing protein [Lachnospiraceae bacterium]